MKIVLLASVIFFFGFGEVNAQNSGNTNQWSFSIESNFYFAETFNILPVIKADRNKLHVESRYNYEDLKTISLWAGYNFEGGNNFTYKVTPMLGGVAGRTGGAAAGLEMDLNFVRLNLYAESEYVFDFESKENNYFYNWLDFSYAPLDFLWFGISGQRTKALNEDSDIQHGFFAGGSYKNFEVNGYMYNPGKDELTYILTLSFGF